MPRITVWVTEHVIAQRVGAALKTGFGEDAALGLASQATPEQIAATLVHIGYGILRGIRSVAELAEAQGKPWFIVDLGYFNPGHFDGFYRIGYRGTQSPFDETIQSAEATKIDDWRTGGEVALLCPPTTPVCDFFKITETGWIEQATTLAKHLGLPAKLRRKGDTEELDTALEKSAAVITFNSAVGWRALQKGIPAFSNTKHSTLGSWHGESVKTVNGLKQLSRENLFGFMKASQLSLLQIQQGKIYDVLARHVPEIKADKPKA